MSKRSRPQPITAPAPESFLPTFDFGASPKPKTSAPLPQRKPLKLTKRLAAFTFLNLEDIAEEGAATANGDDHSNGKAGLVDPLSPGSVYSPISTGGGRTGRFWDFSRNKNSNHSTMTSPMSPTSLPPMSSKAYATLVGGPTTPGSKPIFSPPASRVIRPAADYTRSDSVVSENIELEAPSSTTAATTTSDRDLSSPKTLAVDLVSIFSLTPSDEAEKNRFSFPMPPTFTPRRGSQSPLDPDMSFTSLRGSISSAVGPLSPRSPDSIGSGRSDLSFFSPLFSPSFVDQMFMSDATVTFQDGEVPTPVAPDDTKSVAASSRRRLSKDGSKMKKRRSARPTSLLPPAVPPPRESPPPTPTTPSSFQSGTSSKRRAKAAIRACPSPDLDPELSSASSIHSLLQSGSEASASESESEEPITKLDLDEKTSYTSLFADWGIGEPSRSDSIVTITQRAYNAMRGSISNGNGGRNGSWGSTDVYDNWDQAIDELFTLGIAASRKPSLASIAIAASAEGAASANTSFDVVESMAFVMDDEMRRKLTESQFLVASRTAPLPPVPHSPKPESLASADVTPSASATSSARSSLEEGSPFRSQEPLTPSHEKLNEFEQEFSLDKATATAVTSAKVAAVPERPRPAPLITSRTYPPVNPLRIVKNAPPSSYRPVATEKVPVHPLTPTTVHGQGISPIERPPPAQGVPDEDPIFFSPLSAQSAALAQTVDVDSWPVWSSHDVELALENRRKARKPSSSAVTMMSKFSDDSVEIRLPKVASKRKQQRASPTSPSSNRLNKSGNNLSPGSAHTSYTFLGLKKKKDSSSPTSTSPSSSFPPLPAGERLSSPVKEKESHPRVSMESSLSRTSNDGKKNGLKRPPLPLELFIRA